MNDWQILHRELERSRAESTALHNVPDPHGTGAWLKGYSGCGGVCPLGISAPQPLFGNDRSANLLKNQS